MLVHVVVGVCWLRISKHRWTWSRLGSKCSMMICWQRFVWPRQGCGYEPKQKAHLTPFALGQGQYRFSINGLSWSPLCLGQESKGLGSSCSCWTGQKRDILIEIPLHLLFFFFCPGIAVASPWRFALCSSYLILRSHRWLCCYTAEVKRVEPNDQPLV